MLLLALCALVFSFALHAKTGVYGNGIPVIGMMPMVMPMFSKQLKAKKMKTPKSANANVKNATHKAKKYKATKYKAPKLSKKPPKSARVKYGAKQKSVTQN